MRNRYCILDSILHCISQQQNGVICLFWLYHGVHWNSYVALWLTLSLQLLSCGSVVPSQELNFYLLSFGTDPFFINLGTLINCHSNSSIPLLNNCLWPYSIAWSTSGVLERIPRSICSDTWGAFGQITCTKPRMSCHKINNGSPFNFIAFCFREGGGRTVSERGSGNQVFEVLKARNFF